MKKITGACMLFLTVLYASLMHAAEPSQTLDELLQRVKQGQLVEAKENQTREQRFLREKQQQVQLLADAKKRLKIEEARSDKLEAIFEKNELLVMDKREQLKERMGVLTELFGHLTATAGDLRANVENSLVSVQYPGREVFLDSLISKMSGLDQLPNMGEFEQLWFEIQREMIESGRVIRFQTEVIQPHGTKIEDEVVRVGSFNIVSSQGHYLHLNDSGNLEELSRQPDSTYVSWAKNLHNSTGLTAFGIDPTGPAGGTYLSALIDSPTMLERFEQGGMIGKAIAVLGFVALVLALWRLSVLTSIQTRVQAQLASREYRDDNPLGRILQVHQRNPDTDAETLELKLSEAILKEIPPIEFGLNLLKIIAAVAPLMGLLGTVTGMIITFQAITIFGAGDPKAMAGGISAALVTTVLGLIVAIPTVLLHTLVNSQAKKLIHILDEQSAGLIAEHAEMSKKG
jgi:biopolymer transport protein ExbB